MARTTTAPKLCNPLPYEEIERVSIPNVGEARDTLKAYGYVSEFLHVDPQGNPPADKYAPNVQSFEVYFHEDGRRMVILHEFAKKRGALMNSYLCEVKVKPAFEKAV